MSEVVIETKALTKRYKRLVAVEQLDLRVLRGEVFGLLGPNGAGKTTTLRMLLGLVRPTEGSAVVMGAAPGTAESLARSGALVESPGFYPGLSGRDNLRVLARYAGIPASRVNEVLEEVGLAARAHDRFSAYSQGMKQRLGVAAALLKDPELLVLDEPTNGLDPRGMAEMRTFVRRLGRDGRTVLLSTHLMAEVEQVCDRAAVISMGRVVAEGTVDDLRGRPVLRVVAEPLEEARRLIATMPQVSGVVVADGAIEVAADPGIAPEINRLLVSSGVSVSELGARRPALEDVFLELTETKGG